MTRTRVGFALALVLALGGVAAAHPLEMGTLRVTANTGHPEVDVSLDLDVAMAAPIYGVAPDAITDAMVRSRAGELARATYRTDPIDGCAWSDAPAVATLTRRTITVIDHATCPVDRGALRWSLTFVHAMSPTFQLLVEAHAYGAHRVAVIDKTAPMLEMIGTAPAPTVSLPAFIWKGVEHIGAAPSQWHDRRGWHLPDGIDHIAFLLGLLLAGGTLARLIAIASGFTVGHTITLGLAAFGIARPPSSWIEPLCPHEVRPSPSPSGT